MTHEIDGPDDEQSTDKTEMQVKFAEALNLELDAIGFPASPKRTGALADAVGYGRTQAYRVLKGFGGPSVPTLLALHKIGASIDRVLAEMNQESADVVRLRIGSSVVNAMFQECIAKASPVAAAPAEDGAYDLRAVEANQVLPDNAIRVSSMQFPQRKLLAIVDDDESFLTTVTHQLQGHFRVVAFATAGDFLAYQHGIKSFDLFLIDWLLPDMGGETLVRTIRKASSSPIFILTGATESVDSLTRAMDLPGVRHIGKPVHESILLKHLTQALA